MQIVSLMRISVIHAVTNIPATSNIQASEPKIESKSQSFDDYEKDYLKRLDGEAGESPI